MRASRRAGVACALTTEAACVAPGADPFGWGRFNAYDWDTAGTLAAKLEGWYGWRRDVQGLFLLLIALGSIGVAVLMWRWLRTASPSVRVAGIGLVMLLAFIFVRAASFHHIDYWVTLPIGGMRSGWWLELAAIVVIGSAAATCRGAKDSGRHSTVSPG